MPITTLPSQLLPASLAGAAPCREPASLTGPAPNAATICAEVDPAARGIGVSGHAERVLALLCASEPTR